MRIPGIEATPGTAHRAKYNGTPGGRENSSTPACLVAPTGLSPTPSESVRTFCFIELIDFKIRSQIFHSIPTRAGRRSKHRPAFPRVSTLSRSFAEPQTDCRRGGDTPWSACSLALASSAPLSNIGAESVYRRTAFSEPNGFPRTANISRHRATGRPPKTILMLVRLKLDHHPPHGV